MTVVYIDSLFLLNLIVDYLLLLATAKLAERSFVGPGLRLVQRWGRCMHRQCFFPECFF